MPGTCLTAAPQRAHRATSSTSRTAIAQPDTPQRLNQELSDTSHRSRLGGVFYVLGWVMVCGVSPLAQAALGVSVVVGVLFAAGAVLRFSVSLRPATAADEAERRITSVWLLVGATTLLWGLAAGRLLFGETDPTARLVTLICSVAFATAIAHAFCMREGRAYMVLGSLYLPVLLVLLTDLDGRAVATAMVVFLVYLVLALRRSHREYVHRLDLDEELRRQRDLFEQQSRIDGLTGLANRRRFAEALEQRAMPGAGQSASFALLILDIDHFKAINDLHGHSVGDACLRAFAGLMQHEFAAPGELVVRLGGEEFAVLLDGLDEAGAVARAEAFRARVAGARLLVPERDIGITVSIGVGAFGPSPALDADRSFSAVDAALYRAKAAGRNTVQRVVASG